MKKTQLIFAGIASLLFSNALFSQDTVSTADLLKKIKAQKPNQRNQKNGM